MQLRLLLVVVVICVVAVFSSPCRAAQEATSLSTRLLSSKDQNTSTQRRNLSGRDLRVSSSKEIVTKDTARLSDLFLTRNQPDIQEKRSKGEVGIEPWVPGRGALGIKVEVTW